MYNFTIEELLQYAYNETSSQKTAEIKQALEKDWSLREKLETIMASKSRLEALKLSPKRSTIDNILNYAEKVAEDLTAKA